MILMKKKKKKRHPKETDFLLMSTEFKRRQNTQRWKAESRTQNIYEKMSHTSKGVIGHREHTHTQNLKFQAWRKPR